jgi:hypothetical protein
VLDDRRRIPDPIDRIGDTAEALELVVAAHGTGLRFAGGRSFSRWEA